MNAKAVTPERMTTAGWGARNLGPEEASTSEETVVLSCRKRN